MKDNSDPAVIANLEDKTLVDENVAIVTSDEVNVALNDCKVAMKHIIEFVEPDLHPRLELETLVVWKLGIAANEVGKCAFLGRAKGL